MPEMINVSTWKTDLRALHNDADAIEHRLALFIAVLPDLNDEQYEVYMMLRAAIAAPMAHIRARLTEKELFS